MYATSIGGSKNENNKKSREDKRIKDLGHTTYIDVPVHVNGMIFTFNYKVDVMQRPPIPIKWSYWGLIM